MIQNKENLHPIGTVVELEGVDALYMITGYFRILANGKIMDYAGVHFPYGDTGPDAFLLFNQNMIKQTVSEGYYHADYELFAEHIGEIETEIIEQATFKGLDQ